MTSVTPLARATCDAWPSSPNPVISVAQRAPTLRAATLATRREHSRSNRLGEDEAIAGLRSGIGQHRPRIDASCYREPELDLIVDHRVTTNNDCPRLTNLVVRAAEYFGEHGHRQLVGREPYDVERSERLTAHCVDIGEGVGGGDLTERVRVVNDRREKVDGLHESEIVGHGKDACVVEGVEANEKTRIGWARQCRERAREVARTQLAGSTRAPRERGQPKELGTRLRCRRKVSGRGPWRRCGTGTHPRVAMASISTSTPRGSAATCTVERAGRALPRTRA
jgi:hypothetical protein